MQREGKLREQKKELERKKASDFPQELLDLLGFSICLIDTCTALDERARRVLLSGRSSEGIADTGPLICACFGVGLVAIRDAIVSGRAVNVADIGRTLRAGTNCGSCVPELRAIIERVAETV